MNTLKIILSSTVAILALPLISQADNARSLADKHALTVHNQGCKKGTETFIHLDRSSSYLVNEDGKKVLKVGFRLGAEKTHQSITLRLAHTDPKFAGGKVYNHYNFTVEPLGAIGGFRFSQDTQNIYCRPKGMSLDTMEPRGGQCFCWQNAYTEK